MDKRIAKRTFKVWDYKVSHQQLLIRSPKSDGFDRNVDVIFGAVRLMDVTTFLSEITFEEANEKDFEGLDSKWFKKDSPYSLFILTSGNRRNRIVAAGIKIIENDLDLFESSLESFST